MKIGDKIRIKSIQKGGFYYASGMLVQGLIFTLVNAEPIPHNSSEYYLVNVLKEDNEALISSNPNILRLTKSSNWAILSDDLELINQLIIYPDE